MWVIEVREEEVYSDSQVSGLGDREDNQCWLTQEIEENQVWEKR